MYIFPMRGDTFAGNAILFQSALPMRGDTSCPVIQVFTFIFQSTFPTRGNTREG